VSLPREWIREHEVCVDDMRDAVNCLLELDGIEIAVLLKEVGPGTVKVSLRSKGKVEIHEVAQQLGGGGHAFAAGATLSESLDRSKKTVLGIIAPLLERKIDL
jgi:phosphoesterase RecJ-like protein